MTSQSKEQTLSSAGKIRVFFARLLLLFARRLAFAIAPELKEEEAKRRGNSDIHA